MLKTKRVQTKQNTSRFPPDAEMSSSFSLKAHNIQSKQLLRIPEILQKKKIPILA